MIVLDLKKLTANGLPGKGRTNRPEGTGAEQISVTGDGGGGGPEATAAVLSALEKFVLVGERYKDLALRTAEVKAHLQSGCSSEGLYQDLAEVGAILESYQSRLQDANRETANDFKRIIGLVNESFDCIQIGEERSEERLRYLESSLKQAAKMESLATLRRHLSTMLEYVRNEGKHDLAAKEVRLQSLGEQFRQAQTVSTRLRVHVPGRLDAIAYMKSLLDRKAEAQISLFFVDSLKTIRARHGEEVANGLLDELGRKQVQELAPEGKIFCWSASSLVLIAQPQRKDTSPGLLSALPPTFDYRAFTGTRVATFKVSVRSISTMLSKGYEQVSESLDQFSKE